MFPLYKWLIICNISLFILIRYHSVTFSFPLIRLALKSGTGDTLLDQKLLIDPQLCLKVKRSQELHLRSTTFNTTVTLSSVNNNIDNTVLEEDKL